MTAQLWANSYKPALNSGCYGSFVYATPVEFYPRPLESCFDVNNDKYYVINKFEKTLSHIAFDINEWFPFVKDFTFKTKFIDVSPAMAQSLINFYRTRYCGRTQRMTIEDCANLRYLGKQLSQEIQIFMHANNDDDNNNGKINNTNNNNTNNDEHGNDHGNDDNAEKDNGVFIRFSSRSPKDGHKVFQTNIEEYKQTMLNILQSLIEKYPKDYPFKTVESADCNAQFVAFCKSSNKDLFIDNGRDAMSVILSSERVYSDMLTVVHAHKYPHKYLYMNEFTSKQKLHCLIDDRFVLDSNEIMQLNTNRNIGRQFENETKNEHDHGNDNDNGESEANANANNNVNVAEHKNANENGNNNNSDNRSADANTKTNTKRGSLNNKIDPNMVFDICDVQIAIRKWDPRIRDELEFRCFVYGHELRAISQYNHYCYFAHFANYPAYLACIQRSIHEYWRRYLQAIIPLSKYVIDIAIIDHNSMETTLAMLENNNDDDEHKNDDNNNNNNDDNDGNGNSNRSVDNVNDVLLECIVIELNPFASTTGAGLFSWTHDEEQLKRGTEIEMRVHHKSVLRQEFVDQYVQDFQTYAVEEPWDEVLTKIEAELNKEKKQKSKKTEKDCVIL